VGTIERKGSENLAKSSATAVDQSNLGQPPRTFQRISTIQLRPGMFLVRVLDSWWKSPFFVHRRLLKSSTEIQQLMSSGIREVEIDTSLGVAVSSESESGLDESNLDMANPVMDSRDHDNSGLKEQMPCSPESELALQSEESKIREEVVQLREDVMAAVEGAFEGVKTGQPISQPAVQAAAQTLVQKTLAYPALVAETLLIDSLKQFDKTLYAHVVDTAVYSILVGLQLGWDEGELEKLGVAGLLHDVGYLRLPQNVVKAQWGGGSDSSLLQQHVAMGEALLKRHGQFSSDIVCMVKEHHAYQDGSGYIKGHGGHVLSVSGQLLGMVDYFDELLTVGGVSGSLPAALAMRRMYQEAQKGKFSVLCMDAMIRIFGVFPIGTVVQLSTGEQAVVVKQNSEIGVKPQVKVFQGSDGKKVAMPQVCDLAKDANLGHDVSIVKVLEPTEYSIDLQEYF